VKSLTVYGAMNYTAPPPITKAHVTQADLNEASGSVEGGVVELTIPQNFVQYILVRRYVSSGRTDLLLTTYRTTSSVRSTTHISRCLTLARPSMRTVSIFPKFTA
jgi:hypothetical protein